MEIEACHNKKCENYKEEKTMGCGTLTNNVIVFCERFIGEDEIKKNHYEAKNGMQAIDVINAFDLNFNLGNVIKYTLRAGKKDDTIKDLSKAIDYLNYEIDKIESQATLNYISNTVELEND